MKRWATFTPVEPTVGVSGAAPAFVSRRIRTTVGTLDVGTSMKMTGVPPLRSFRVWWNEVAVKAAVELTDLREEGASLLHSAPSGHVSHL